MKIRTTIFAILLTLVLAPQAFAVEECSAIPWGESISAVEQITFSHTLKGVKYYTVTKVEPCGIFNIQGAHVTYGFLNAKLYTVLVEIEKVNDVKDIVSVLMDTYGMPDHKKVESWDVYRWETDDLKIKLKSQYSSDRIKVGMYYKPLIPKE